VSERGDDIVVLMGNEPSFTTDRREIAAMILRSPRRLRFIRKLVSARLLAAAGLVFVALTSARRSTAGGSGLPGCGSAQADGSACCLGAPSGSTTVLIPGRGSAVVAPPLPDDVFPRGDNDPDVAETTLPPSPQGILPPPSTCAAFGIRAAAGPKPQCATRQEALTALDEALDVQSAASRDGRLVALESCWVFPAGVIRGIRAELSPACADVIVAPSLLQTLRVSVQHALIGAALGARALRTKPAPAYIGTGTPDSITTYLQTRMHAWDSQTVAALKELEATASTLTGYGHALALAAVAQGYGLHMDGFRRVPYPREWDRRGNDGTVRLHFFEVVNQASVPTREVALRQTTSALYVMGDTGATTHRMTDALRTWLHRNFRRQFLDLAVAMPPPAAPAGTLARLAARLPTFYAGVVLGTNATCEDVLRQWSAQGVPQGSRGQLSGNLAALSPDGRLTYADAMLRTALTFGRRVDHDELAHAVAAAVADSPSDHASFVRAVMTAIRPAQFEGSPDVLSFSRGAAKGDLDAVVGPFAGYAHLLAGDMLVEADGSPRSEVLTQAGRRYDEAATELPEPAARVARERAQGVRDIVRYLNRSAEAQTHPAAVSPGTATPYVLADHPRWGNIPPLAPDARQPMSVSALQSSTHRDFFPLASRCYDRALRTDPSLKGRVVLAFTIARDGKGGGRVEAVDVLNESTLRDPQMIRCLRRSFFRVRFPSPPGRENVNVVYPVMFDANGSD
jgi:hypothetical protein